jgi:hypothetical protein
MTTLLMRPDPVRLQNEMRSRFSAQANGFFRPLVDGDRRPIFLGLTQFSLQTRLRVIENLTLALQILIPFPGAGDAQNFRRSTRLAVSAPPRSAAALLLNRNPFSLKAA